MLTEKICDKQLEPYCFQTNKNPFCDLLLTVDILFWLRNQNSSDVVLISEQGKY